MKQQHNDIKQTLGSPQGSHTSALLGCSASSKADAPEWGHLRKGLTQWNKMI
jgi:hypothetical protein